MSEHKKWLIKEEKGDPKRILVLAYIDIALVTGLAVYCLCSSGVDDDDDDDEDEKSEEEGENEDGPEENNSGKKTDPQSLDEIEEAAKNAKKAELSENLLSSIKIEDGPQKKRESKGKGGLVNDGEVGDGIKIKQRQKSIEIDVEMSDLKR